ncbi:hypothetical protein [Halotalea alkalilenta]|uniref:hypothetical protein n=1 Tax=Halotalea alkalilenta TaxID=376489 RepID=UPI000486143C|nr:hypothetical protein [Halotalea alkalilenta]
MRQKLPIFLACALIAFFLVLAWRVHFSPDPAREGFAHSVAALNAELPARIDEETRIDAVTLDWSSREVRYRYTMLQHTAGEFDPDTFTTLTLEQLRRSLCRQNPGGLASAVASGLRMRHSYEGADGAPIASILIDPKDCRQPSRY